VGARQRVVHTLSSRHLDVRHFDGASFSLEVRYGLQPLVSFTVVAATSSYLVKTKTFEGTPLTLTTMPPFDRVHQSQ